MMLVSAVPVAALRDFVRDFQQREVELGGNAIAYPIAARPEQLLEFYLREPYLVHSCGSGSQQRAPRAVVVGPTTCRRIELVLRGSLDVFTVHFQPAGFHGAFGLPMSELSDRACEARSVIGPFASEMERRIAGASNFDERVNIATSLLLRQVDGRALDAVAITANRIRRDRGAVRIRQAARSAGLSMRQFERRFCQQVGINPKLYATIVRFDCALRVSMDPGARTWADIASELGYFDQMHMVHDFRRFCGETPTKFSTRYAAMPPAWR